MLSGGDRDVRVHLNASRRLAERARNGGKLSGSFVAFVWGLRMRRGFQGAMGFLLYSYYTLLYFTLTMRALAAMFAAGDV